MRSVCGCTPASYAATEMTYKPRGSAIGTLPVGDVGEQAGTRVRVGCGRKGAHRVTLTIVELGRDDDLDRHEEVAALLAGVGLVARHSLPAHAQHLAARGTRRD